MRLVAPWMLASAALACGGAEPTEPAQPKIPVVTGQQVDHAHGIEARHVSCALTGIEEDLAISGFKPVDVGVSVQGKLMVVG